MIRLTRNIWLVVATAIGVLMWTVILNAIAILWSLR